MKVFESAYGFDEEIAKGKWFTTQSGVKVKLAYQNSEHVLAYIRSMANDLSVELGRELTESEHEEIGRKAFQEKVLLDWKADIPYNKENFNLVFKKYPQFVNECISIAKNNKRFQNERIDETTGNS